MDSNTERMYSEVERKITNHRIVTSLSVIFMIICFVFAIYSAMSSHNLSKVVVDVVGENKNLRNEKEKLAGDLKNSQDTKQKALKNLATYYRRSMNAESSLREAKKMIAEAEKKGYIKPEQNKKVAKKQQPTPLKLLYPLLKEGPEKKGK